MKAWKAVIAASVAGMVLPMTIEAGAYAAPPLLPATNPNTYDYSVNTQTPYWKFTFTGKAWCDFFWCTGQDNTSKWTSANLDSAVSFGLVPATDPSTNAASLRITVGGKSGFALGDTIPGGLTTQLKVPISLISFQRYRVTAYFHSNTTFTTRFRIGVGGAAAGGKGPDVAMRTFVLGTGTNCTHPVNKPNDYVCSFDLVYAAEDGMGNVPYNALLWMIPNSYGIDVNLDSLEIDKVNADPHNQAGDLVPANIAVDPKMFGFTINAWDAHKSTNGNIPVWPVMGQKMLRLWSNGLYWGAFQPTNSSNWLQSTLDRYDMFSNLAYSHGADAVMTLGLTPPWAADIGGCAAPQYVDDGGQVVGCQGSPNTSANLDAWVSYVKTIASRNPSKVKYFELWNEPDFAGYYGSGADMANLARLARQALTTVEPTPGAFKLIVPTIKSTGALFLDEFLAAGGGQYVDIFSYHSYYNVKNLEQKLSADTANARLTMNNYGYASKPLWNTEGSPSCDATSVVCTATTSPSADILRGLHPRTMATLLANGVSNFDYYFMEGMDSNQPWMALATAASNYSVLTDNGKGFKVASQWLSPTTSAPKRGWWLTGSSVFIQPLYDSATSKTNYMVWNTGTSSIVVDIPTISWGMYSSSSTLTTTDATVPPVYLSTLPVNYLNGRVTITLQPMSPVLLKP